MGRGGKGRGGEVHVRYAVVVRYRVEYGREEGREGTCEVVDVRWWT